MNRQRIIILLGVSIIGCLVIDSGIHSLNESNNKLLINYKNVELGIQNSQEISQINVANKWNQDIFNMQLSDDGNLIINPFYPLAVTNPAYKGNNAIIVNVTNSENELLYTYSGSGAIAFKVYDALNGKSVKDGDVVTIISNDQSIISDSNSNNETNQSNSDTESFIIKNNEFVKLYRPSITVDDGNLSVESKEYPDAKIIYKINGKSYEGTLVNGKFNAILPNGLPVNQEIEVELITPDIHTIEYAVYTQFSNQELNQTYNMSRRGSINPKGLWGRRGNDLALTAFQPIPITFDDKGGSISIEIKGPINGTANVDINNGTGLNKIITQIPVNQVVNVKIPGEGAIFLDTSNIQSMGNNEWEPFNFTTTVKVESGFYRKIPVFDNREGEKLFDGVYTDNSKFVSDITSSDNINYPAIILGKYLVMYINNVAEINLDTNIDFNKVINLYNQTFVEDNKINGLSMNAENPINKFQVNNFFVSTDTDVPAGTIYTGDGTATYTLPSLFSYLLEPGWVVFHELGHIFNPRWAGNFLNGEVFSNMYTMISQEKIEGSSTWLFSGDQKYFEDTTILPIFTKYYEGSTSDNYLTNNYHTGLYYFYLLQEYYPDYVQKLSQLYSSEVVNGTLPYNNGDFLPYAMAKLYHVNIIPSLARWGNVVTNQNLIDFVIQNSTSSINLVPKNNDIFTSYSDITVVPTLNSIEVNGNTGIIQGIDNANTTVYVKYANNLYSGQTDSKGKFSINIPLQKSENKAVIYATGEGLKESLSKTIDIDTSKVTETINKDILKNEIEIASKINTDEYTDSSVQVLKNALNQAQNIVDDQNATQQEVSESTNILKEAIESLVKVQSINNLVKDVYWDGDALVINGELNGANMSSNVVKRLEITNEYGESVTLTGANVNWYSGNADNYNGYQFVIRQSLLRNLVGE
ncbi:MAG: M60 family metallopeptidase, partial [Sarcina sp.]